MSGNANGKALGALLKELRRQRGITRLELSHRIGAHVSTIGRWERGQSSPDAWWSDAFRRVLGPEFDLSGVDDAAPLYRSSHPHRDAISP